MVGFIGEVNPGNGIFAYEWNGFTIFQIGGIDEENTEYFLYHSFVPHYSIECQELYQAIRQAEMLVDEFKTFHCDFDMLHGVYVAKHNRNFKSFITKKMHELGKNTEEAL